MMKQITCDIDEQDSKFECLEFVAVWKVILAPKTCFALLLFLVAGVSVGVEGGCHEGTF